MVEDEIKQIVEMLSLKMGELGSRLEIGADVIAKAKKDKSVQPADIIIAEEKYARLESLYKRCTMAHEILCNAPLSDVLKLLGDLFGMKVEINLYESR